MKYGDLLVTKWNAQFLGRKFPVSIGGAGIGEKRGEGDMITPRGEFRVEGWMFRPDRVRGFGSAITWRDGWSDDAASPDYNQRIKRPYAASHERLFRADPLYNLIGILDYNRNPIEKGKGSAIFLHSWRRPRYPTEGCVAFAPKDLLWIALHWGPHSKVIIR